MTFPIEFLYFIYIVAGIMIYFVYRLNKFVNQQKKDKR